MSNDLIVRKQSEHLSVMTPQGYETAMSFCKTLLDSGFLPKAIQRPAQALAVILAGQEYGLPPMQALRQIHIVEGKPTLSAELMLSLFKKRGGQARWKESTDRIAVLWLKDANGDEHTETWTIEDAIKAEVSKKDNWRKYPKAMLRARCISAGIKALGDSEGFYTSEELGGDTHPDDLKTVDAVVVDEGRRGPKAGPSARSASSPIAETGSVTATIQSAQLTGDLTTDPKEHPAVALVTKVFHLSSPSADGAAPSESAAPSMETPANESQQSEPLPERIRTTDEELAVLAEPDEGEELDFVEHWEFHKTGSNKAHTATGEWVKHESPSQRRTLKQNARLNVLRNLLELSDEDWHKGLRMYYNKESSRDLSIEEATDMISKLETRYNQRKHKTPTAKLAAKWESHNNYGRTS